MPKDYYPFVFLFEDETIDGYAEAITKALQLSEQELNEFGNKAKNFVLNNKNNFQQAQRVLNFINQ